MPKIITTILITGVLVLFGMQNSSHVPISLIFGSPTKVRLVFLLGIAAIIGYLLAYIQGLHRETKLKKEIRKMANMYEETMRRERKNSEEDEWSKAG